MNKEFVIRRSFLLPLGLLGALIIALGVVCIIQDQPAGKAIILGALLIPVLGLFVESLFRRAIVSEDRLTVKKALREKSVSFSEVTALDLVVVKKRAFLSLSTEESFLILSNAYRDFPELVASLAAKVPEGVMSEETRENCRNVPVKTADIVSCWLAVGLVLFILYLQLFA
ncbi:MAG: hypothetical protein GWO11_05480 [Desulfuromonadales bacterium]|nr:hypothetical protein [Desulfuromonadales bacterium]NIR33844.1 hypothetical protein [Desulfuromonadales bacterium]NIS42524.1 hypothetical protein [Desulfuromonadales bacterium]